MGGAFYTELAKHYDKIYHYIDYKKQVQFLIKVIEEFNKSNNSKILDVACGTGVHADLLQKEGFKIVGVDISPEMLVEAKKKNSNIEFIEGDMRQLKLKESFGVVMCFFNSILYNKNNEEMKKTLTNFYDILEKGGILIFDTVDKSIGINSEPYEFKYEDDNLKIEFKPQWVYDQEKNAMNLAIDFVVNNEEMHDHHAMGAFSFEELKEILTGIGFEVKILEKNFENIEAYNSDKKLSIFVCKK